METGLKEVAAKYYRYYDGMHGVYRSATISLVNTRYLPELARKTQQLMCAYPIVYTDFQIKELQRLDFLLGSPTTSFDFMDFLFKNFGASPEVAAVDALLDNLVVYRAYTPYFNNQLIRSFSCISCYVPGMLQGEATAQRYYKTLFWYAESGFKYLF